MDKRILESVKEFYRNVKGQEFSLDTILDREYFPQEEKKNTDF